jgi:hypothetical protein
MPRNGLAAFFCSDANIASTPNKPQRKKRFPRPVFATNHLARLDFLFM